MRLISNVYTQRLYSRHELYMYIHFPQRNDNTQNFWRELMRSVTRVAINPVPNEWVLNQPINDGLLIN